MSGCSLLSSFCRVETLIHLNILIARPYKLVKSECEYGMLWIKINQEDRHPINDNRFISH